MFLASVEVRVNKVTISIPHFYGLEYAENNKKLILEIDFRETKIFIGKSLIKKWEIPFENEEISEEKRGEIYKNIKKYLLESYNLEDLVEID